MVSKFFMNMDPALAKNALQSVFRLGSLYAEYLMSQGDQIQGIKPLMIAIQKLQAVKTEKELYHHPICGSLHREFAKLCLKAKCYQHSLKLIESPVISFMKHTQPMDVVTYLYYKGLLYTGLQRYEEAMEQFRLVISYPAQCVHKVHSESYKKLLLLTLIQVSEGKLPRANTQSHLANIVPKNAAPTLKYKLEQSFPSYHNLAEFFVNSKSKPQAFEEYFASKAEEFIKDQNLGLVKKLAKAFREPLRIKMVELSDTYLTLKLNEIENNSHQEAEDKKGE